MTTTLITGATRGLGREVAEQLVQAGHTVYLGARDLVKGSAVAGELGAVAIQIDVVDEASVLAAVDRITAEVGYLDVLVNNAGIAGEQRPPAEATIADLENVFETNVFGATRVLSAFTPLLDASDATVVVNVSSRVGSLNFNAGADSPWQLLAYPMSKAALNMLTIQYAHAFPRWRVNSATPGLTATGFAPNIAGGHSVEDGAKPIVKMASIRSDGPTGTFVGPDGPVAW